MKLWLLLVSLSLGVLTVGAHNMGRMHLHAVHRSILEYELDRARQHAPVELLVDFESEPQAVRERARSRSAKRHATILAITAREAMVVPSPVDAKLGSERSWSALVDSAVWPFLEKADARGATSALVRTYSNALVERGLLSALPPRPPVFLPDVQAHAALPSDMPLFGLGVLLLSLSLTELGAARRRRRPSASG